MLKMYQTAIQYTSALLQKNTKNFLKIVASVPDLTYWKFVAIC